jgi:hypothetical protein
MLNFIASEKMVRIVTVGKTVWEGLMWAQGIVGSTPWNAMVFFTLWLQLLGFSDLAASVLMATFALGCALGSLLGGCLGAGLDLIQAWNAFVGGISYFGGPCDRPCSSDACYWADPLEHHIATT